MTDPTFAAIDLTADNPPGICTACRVHGLEHVPTGTVVVYCEHTMTGAFHRPGESWTRRENITADNFKRAVLAGVFLGEQVAAAIATDGMTEQ